MQFPRVKIAIVLLATFATLNAEVVEITVRYEDPVDPGVITKFASTAKFTISDEAVRQQIWDQEGTLQQDFVVFPLRKEIKVFDLRSKTIVVHRPKNSVRYLIPNWALFPLFAEQFVKSNQVKLLEEAPGEQLFLLKDTIRVKVERSPGGTITKVSKSNVEGDWQDVITFDAESGHPVAVYNDLFKTRGVLKYIVDDRDRQPDDFVFINPLQASLADGSLNVLPIPIVLPKQFFEVLTSDEMEFATVQSNVPDLSEVADVLPPPVVLGVAKEVPDESRNLVVTIALLLIAICIAVFILVHNHLHRDRASGFSSAKKRKRTGPDRLDQTCQLESGGQRGESG